jgi:tRNA pseudouridine38-40 synthase
MMPGEELPPGIFRLALGVEYAGSQYSGWQRLPAAFGPTVQGSLETALSFVANEPIVVTCAGRTDTGVHATGQVVHFDTVAIRPDKSWILGVNSRLPPDIRIRWVKPVVPQFHARFSAVARTYRYLIANTPTPPALAVGQCLWVREELNIPAMQKAAEYCLGTRDFSSVRGSHCQAKSPVRTLHHFTVSRCNDWLIMEIKGNAFLHHMVRNLMGLLLPVGKGLQKPEWVQGILEARDRIQGGKTEAPGALYLVKVDYDSDYGLPVMPKGPFMLADNI